MKVYLFFAVLILGFTLTIIAAVKPEAIEKKYWEVREPFDRLSREKQEELWRTAKEQERAHWMLRLNLPDDCQTAFTEVRKLECKNITDLHAREFEKLWRSKIAQGWHPE